MTSYLVEVGEHCPFCFVKQILLVCRISQRVTEDHWQPSVVPPREASWYFVLT